MKHFVASRVIGVHVGESALDLCQESVERGIAFEDAPSKLFVIHSSILTRHTAAESEELNTGTPQAQLQTAIDLIQEEKKAAETWLESHDTGSGSIAGGPRVTRVSFENSR